jgi:hypothetical protein
VSIILVSLKCHQISIAYIILFVLIVLLSIFNENRLVLHNWCWACPIVFVLVFNYLFLIVIIDLFNLFFIFLIDVLYLYTPVIFRFVTHILDVRVHLLLLVELLLLFLLIHLD